MGGSVSTSREGRPGKSCTSSLLYLWFRDVPFFLDLWFWVYREGKRRREESVGGSMREDRKRWERKKGRGVRGISPIYFLLSRKLKFFIVILVSCI